MARAEMRGGDELPRTHIMGADGAHDGAGGEKGAAIFAPRMHASTPVAEVPPLRTRLRSPLRSPLSFRNETHFRQTILGIGILGAIVVEFATIAVVEFATIDPCWEYRADEDNRRTLPLRRPPHVATTPCRYLTA